MNELEKQANSLEEKMSEKQRENEKLRSKLEESDERLKSQRQERQRAKIQFGQLKSQTEILKSELNRK